YHHSHIKAHQIVNRNESIFRGRHQRIGNCNLFEGKWVFNMGRLPLYDFSTCPFINPEFDCLKYGTPAKMFLQYSWATNNCVIPRGKIIMFVSGSLSLNQWNSLTCMIHASVLRAKYTTGKRGAVYSVNF
ncbi:Protein trichome birefringence-like 38, partial [Bienertia sinuspersici]